MGEGREGAIRLMHNSHRYIHPLNLDSDRLLCAVSDSVSYPTFPSCHCALSATATKTTTKGTTIIYCGVTMMSTRLTMLLCISKGKFHEDLWLPQLQDLGTAPRQLIYTLGNSIYIYSSWFSAPKLSWIKDILFFCVRPFFLNGWTCTTKEHALFSRH